MNSKIDNELLSIFKKSNIDISKVKKIKNIKKGLTNKIYKVLLKDNPIVLKVRITNKNVPVNRIIEQKIEHNLNRSFIFYDNDGNYITEWIKGNNINTIEKYNIEFWRQISKFIDDFRALNKNLEINFDKDAFIISDNILRKQDNVFNAMYNEYLSIIDNFNNENTVITHTDISMLNIIKRYKNNYYVIDFEWVTKAHEYWDIANLIKDFSLNIKSLLKINLYLKLDFYKLVQIIFAVHIYTLIWTFKMNETKHIISYRNKIYKKTVYWFSEFNKLKISTHN